MKPGSQQDLDYVAQQSREFPEQFKSVLMASSSAENSPCASYAPYVKREGSYYIFVSELSQHTKNLLEQPKCSLLFIENEQDAAHLFARRRLSLDCLAQEHQRGTQCFEDVINEFQDKFGSFVDVIKTLTDFHLFELKVQKGAYVNGFAKAYYLTGDDLGEVVHRNEQGHQSTKNTDAISL